MDYDALNNRDWMQWLTDNLSFPFQVERVEDINLPFDMDPETEPFRLGHVMKAVGIEMEDDRAGIIIKVREGRRRGHAPLAEVEVCSPEDKNHALVMEYADWLANH